MPDTSSVSAQAGAGIDAHCSTPNNHSPTTNNPAAASSSYAQILRSSSIIGGATGINYIIGLIRTKAVAVLLGPSEAQAFTH